MPEKNNIVSSVSLDSDTEIRNFEQVRRIRWTSEATPLWILQEK